MMSKVSGNGKFVSFDLKSPVHVLVSMLLISLFIGLVFTLDCMLMEIGMMPKSLDQCCHLRLLLLTAEFV